METKKKTTDRQALPCPHAKKCGGCQLQNMDYPQQLAWKENRVRQLIGRFGPVRPIIGMSTPYHYRNKVQAAFGLDGRRRIISGVYQSSSHRIVPVDKCLIEDETADQIIVTIRSMMPDFRMLAYDERTGTGFLRHVLVKRGFATGQVMVVLVAASPIFKLQKPFISKLLALHPEITTIVLNVNDRFTPLVLGQREKVLYGKGYIEDVLCGKTFRISPRSFYQINPVQTEVLYNTAMDMAGLTGRETVLDAYCGTGTIALIANGRAGKVLGVELNRDAVRDAIANARQNGVTNCWFTAADAGEYMEDMAAHHDRPDVVFMDPPRAGSDERFLRSLLRLSPPRVVYISCNPETLSRDLDILHAGGYTMETAQPVDMFPWTGHVETVCSLSKPHSKHHIEKENTL
ncbi:MAG: 23S rRNA (uracil(1939)-C(5))-methyltransferase RlmD [Oscillospiraceae bacterium]|nr:23S rRNA (uracil(1939)-C(5))-methyltransferase RlmD [Oscillospiraceae bacterium]